MVCVCSMDAVIAQAKALVKPGLRDEGPDAGDAGQHEGPMWAGCGGTRGGMKGLMRTGCGWDEGPNARAIRGGIRAGCGRDEGPDAWRDAGGMKAQMREQYRAG